MSWTSFFGDIAKDLAKGYIEERGAKGTLDDLSSLARSIFDSDNVESGNEDIYSELCESINQLINQSDYPEAIDLLNEFYEDNFDNELDVIYYYLASEITVAMLEEYVGEKSFNEIKELAITHINEGLEFDDDDFVDEFDSLTKRVKKAINRNKLRNF